MIISMWHSKTASFVEQLMYGKFTLLTFNWFIMWPSMTSQACHRVWLKIYLTARNAPTVVAVHA